MAHLKLRPVQLLQYRWNTKYFTSLKQRSRVANSAYSEFHLGNSMYCQRNAKFLANEEFSTHPSSAALNLFNYFLLLFLFFLIRFIRTIVTSETSLQYAVFGSSKTWFAKYVYVLRESNGRKTSLGNAGKSVVTR